MSIWIPGQAGTDLSAAQPGTSGTIPIGITDRPSAIGNSFPKLVFNNESGCGLAINMQGSNRQIFLPAGAWSDPFDLLNNDTAINWIVQYVLPNQPVAKLYIVLYWPNEKPLKAVALGNSPIGISGGVSTTAGKTLQDDTDNPGTSFIEATPTDQTTSSWAMKNDASGFIQVLSANVLRKIWNITRGNSGSGKATIDIGDSGDLSITTYHGVFDTNCAFPPGQVTAGSFQRGKYNFFAALDTGTAAGIEIVTHDGTQGEYIGYGESTNTEGAGFFIKDVVGGAYLVKSGSLQLAALQSGALPSGVTIPGSQVTGDLAANQIGAGALDSDVTIAGSQITGDVAANQIGSGALDTDVTIIATQIVSGNIPSAVKNQDGNQLVGSEQTGGAGAGRTIWIGTTDPGGSAAEGDIWIDA